MVKFLRLSFLVIKCTLKSWRSLRRRQIISAIRLSFNLQSFEIVDYLCWTPQFFTFHSCASSKLKSINCFRPRLAHWNEGVYCTPIDRALKMQFNKRCGSFQQSRFLNYEIFSTSNCAAFWTKQIHKYKTILNNFSSQNKGF